MNEEFQKHLFTTGPMCLSEVLGREVVTGLELSCIQLNGHHGRLILKDHLAIFVHMLRRQRFTSTVYRRNLQN